MNDLGLVFALTGTVLGALLPGIGSAIGVGMGGCLLYTSRCV